jgi:hypothetical protein
MGRVHSSKHQGSETKYPASETSEKEASICVKMQNQVLSIKEVLQ